MDLKGLDAFSSGAITISKESSPKRTFNNVPLIDRSSKPVSRFNTLDVELMNAKNNAVSSVEIDNSKDDASLHSMNETLNSTRLNLESSLPGNSILDNAIQDSSKRNNNSLLRYTRIFDIIRKQLNSGHLSIISTQTILVSLFFDEVNRVKL